MMVVGHVIQSNQCHSYQYFSYYLINLTLTKRNNNNKKENVLMSCFIQVSYLFDQALQQQHHYLYKGILQQISIDILIKLEDLPVWSTRTSFKVHGPSL